MNNKGTDQTAQMRRLICAFVVRMWQKRFPHDVAHMKPDLKLRGGMIQVLRINIKLFTVLHPRDDFLKSEYGISIFYRD